PGGVLAHERPRHARGPQGGRGRQGAAGRVRLERRGVWELGGEPEGRDDAPRPRVALRQLEDGWRIRVRGDRLPERTRDRRRSDLQRLRPEPGYDIAVCERDLEILRIDRGEPGKRDLQSRG